MINWDSPYMQNGYYYAMVNDVTVECYNPPSGANIQGSKSYIYTDVSATNNTIEETNTIVILGSLQANGNDPGLGASSTAKSGSAATNTPESVPGESGIGAEGDGDADGNGSGSGTASAGSAATSSASGFSQGNPSSGKSEGDKITARVGGSVFAVLVAVAAALCL